MATRQHPPHPSFLPSLPPGEGAHRTSPASGSAPGLALLLLRSKHLLQENLQGAPGWRSPGNLVPAAPVPRAGGFGDPAGCSQLWGAGTAPQGRQCCSKPRSPPWQPRSSPMAAGEAGPQGAPPVPPLAPLQHSACTNPAPPSQPPTLPRQPGCPAPHYHSQSGIMFFRERTEQFVTKP